MKNNTCMFYGFCGALLLAIVWFTLSTVVANKITESNLDDKCMEKVLAIGLPYYRLQDNEARRGNEVFTRSSSGIRTLEPLDPRGWCETKEIIRISKENY